MPRILTHLYSSLDSFWKSVTKTKRFSEKHVLKKIKDRLAPFIKKGKVKFGLAPFIKKKVKV